MALIGAENLPSYGMMCSIALTVCGCAAVFFFRGPAGQRWVHVLYRWMFSFTTLLLTLSWVSEPFVRVQRIAPRIVLGFWERWLFASMLIIPAYPVLELIAMRNSRSKENDRALMLDVGLGASYLALISFTVIVALPRMAG
jgi:hypothetical protein